MIPFTIPLRCDSEHSYLDEALATGLSSGDGPFTRATALLRPVIGGGDVLLTRYGGVACEMVAITERHSFPAVMPLHSSPVDKCLGRTAADGCEITTDVADSLVRLPLFPGLPDSHLDRAIDPALDFAPQP